VEDNTQQRLWQFDVLSLNDKRSY